MPPLDPDAPKPYVPTREQELRAALELCFELLDNSDVAYFISHEQGEQAKYHKALRAALLVRDKTGSPNRETSDERPNSRQTPDV